MFRLTILKFSSSLVVTLSPKYSFLWILCKCFMVGWIVVLIALQFAVWRSLTLLTHLKTNMFNFYCLNILFIFPWNFFSKFSSLVFVFCCRIFVYWDGWSLFHFFRYWLSYCCVFKAFYLYFSLIGWWNFRFADVGKYLELFLWFILFSQFSLIVVKIIVLVGNRHWTLPLINIYYFEMQLCQR